MRGSTATKKRPKTPVNPLDGAACLSDNGHTGEPIMTTQNFEFLIDGELKKFTTLRVNATQFVIVEGNHQFYEIGKMYFGAYDKSTGFMIMNAKEIHDCVKNGNFGFMNFKGV
jgi:hypothetical protein